jgi:lipopolysaccharide export system permease protein
VSLSTIGKVFLLYVPLLLGYTLPIACIISVILAFSRLSADNEILAMRACGIYLKSILPPLIIIGTILSLFTFILNDRIIPYTHHEQRKMLKSLGTKNPTALLEPGVFINSFKNQTIFIHRIEANKLFNVTIYQHQPDEKPTRTIIAKRGEFSAVPGKNQIILKLIDGSSDEPNLENPNNFYKLRFNTLFITLDALEGEKKIQKKPRSMTLKELKAEIDKFERLFIKEPRLKTEYYRKITWAFSPMIFILLGFPLAVITNKREKSANIIIAFLAVAVYYLLSLGCEALSLEDIIPSHIIMWGPNAIAGAAMFILNYKVCRA